MKNVDAAAYLETMYGLIEKYYAGLNMRDKCREAIDKAKSLLSNIECDKITLCKDCKYAYKDNSQPQGLWCDRLVGTYRVEESDFCSFGKEKYYFTELR